MSSEKDQSIESFESKAKLREFARHLRRELKLLGPEPHLKSHLSPIPPSLIEFVAEGLDRFLGGKAKSLDAAFELTYRGSKRLRTKARRRAQTIKATGLRKSGLKWAQVADQVGASDIDALRRDVRTEGPALLSKQATRQLARKLTKRLKKADRIKQSIPPS